MIYPALYSFTVSTSAGNFVRCVSPDVSALIRARREYLAAPWGGIYSPEEIAAKVSEIWPDGARQYDPEAGAPVPLPVVTP